MNRDKLTPLLVACSIALATFTTHVWPAEERSDTWSEAVLVTTYTLNWHLNPFDIHVEVENGTAHLTGVVESDVERDLAEEIAIGVEGIDKVDNRLEVKPEAETAPPARTTGFMAQVNDANITARVKSQLLWNRNTHGLQIDVDTEQQVVTLKGNVATAAEGDLAGQIARNTTDVREVRNELQVAPGGEGDNKAMAAARDAGRKMSDAWITAKVKSALIYNRGVDAEEIDVDTRDGVVYLKGSVDSEAEKRTALSIAGDIRGVGKVVDSLQIRSGS